MENARISGGFAKDGAVLENIVASDGFLEAIKPETDFVRKQELEEQLLRYCRFDTEAMVEIVKFLKDLGE